MDLRAALDKFTRQVTINFLTWFLAFSFWGLMRQFGQELVGGPELGIGEWALNFLILALVAGVAFGVVDMLLPAKIFKKTSFGRVVLLRAIIYAIIFFLLTVVGITTFSLFDQEELSFNERYGFIFSNEMLLLLFYCFMVVFSVHFVRELDRKLGPGNLIKLIFGSFHKPKEENRLFMFLDLKSSTSIAEKLGHIKYSQLIQDCFLDLEVVFKYKAEVYQYVGDEVVLTWTIEKGVLNTNGISAFFEYKRRLRSRADYYKKNYQLVPEFKAGLNVGLIVVAEVGQQKREIAYHGDTINTAARIQSECGVLNQEILVSEKYYQSVSSNSEYDFTYQGEVRLKGKEMKTKIYSVKEANHG